MTEATGLHVLSVSEATYQGTSPRSPTQEDMKGGNNGVISFFKDHTVPIPVWNSIYKLGRPTDGP